MPKYKIRYRRVEEGEFTVNASSEHLAQCMLKIELACGTAPTSRIEDMFLETTIVEEGNHNA